MNHEQDALVAAFQIQCSEGIRLLRLLGDASLRSSVSLRGVCAGIERHTLWTWADRSLIAWNTTTRQPEPPIVFNEDIRHVSCTAHTTYVLTDTTLYASEQSTFVAVHTLDPSLKSTMLLCNPSPVEPAALFRTRHKRTNASRTRQISWASSPTQVINHNRYANVALPSYSPNGSWLLCRDDERNEVVVRDAQTHKVRSMLQSPVAVIAAHWIDNNSITVVLHSHEIWFLQVDQPVAVRIASITLQHDVTHVTFSSQGHLALIHSPNSQMCVIDTRNRSVLSQFQLSQILPVDNDTILTTISDSGMWICFALAHETLAVVDARTGSVQQAPDGHVSPIAWLAWTSDSRLLSQAASDPITRHWDTQTADTIELSELPRVSRNAPVLHPQHRTALAANDALGLFVFDVVTGAVLHALPTIKPLAFALSPSGDTVFAVQDKGFQQPLEVIVWPLAHANTVIQKPLPYKDTDRHISLLPTSNPTGCWVLVDTNLFRLNATGDVDFEDSRTPRRTSVVSALLRDNQSCIASSNLEVYRYSTEPVLERIDLARDQSVWQHDVAHTIHGIVVASHDDWFVCSHTAGITVHSTHSGSEIASLSLGYASGFVRTIALSPNNTTLAVGTHYGLVWLFALDNQALSLKARTPNRM